MIINRANLSMLTTGYRANFMAGLGAAASMYARFATRVPSTTAQELYPWLADIPGMRKWVGERQIKNVEAGAYTIINEDWEDTISVKRNAIEDDTYGVYSPLFSMLGDAAGRQPDELMFGFLAKGFSTNCFDGQFFFDTDHPVLDANGSPVSFSNMQAGAGSPWYLMDVSKAVKPLIFQDRQKPRFVGLDQDNDDKVFMRKEFIYGADSRNAAGFGFWQTAFGSKATLDAANFGAAYTAMTTLKGDYGAPLAITPNVLVTGPTNRAAAEVVLKKANLAGGESNLDFNRVELVIAPWLG